MLLVLLLPVISAANLEERVAGVAPHWEEVCNTSLLFSEETKSWDDATTFCELFGGSLVEIRSMFMNYCILRHAHHKGLSYYYWHSGNDIDEEGVYRYNRAGDFPPLPGDLITWSPIWNDPLGGPGLGRMEPNGGRDHNCLMVQLSSDYYAGKWADHP